MRVHGGRYVVFVVWFLLLLDQARLLANVLACRDEPIADEVIVLVERPALLHLETVWAH